MMTKPPHFLLFSESTSESRDRETSVMSRASEGVGTRGAHYPSWHFLLRARDGSTYLNVSDQEKGASEERLELLAVVRGLEALDQPSRVTVVTSRRSIYHALRFGLDAWRENGWQWEHFGTMAPIKHADLWQRIDRALSFHELQCRLVRRDPPSDDLSVSRSRQHAARLPRGRPAAVGAVAHRGGRGRRIADLFHAPRLTGLYQGVRGLFSWCGLCRSEPSLVIAAH